MGPYGKDNTNTRVIEGLTSIQEHAFWNCASLKHISLPEGLTTMRDTAFDGCTSLTKIILPKGLRLMYK